MGVRTAVSARSWLQNNFARTRLSALLSRRYLNPASMGERLSNISSLTICVRELPLARVEITVHVRWPLDFAHHFVFHRLDMPVAIAHVDTSVMHHKPPVGRSSFGNEIGVSHRVWIFIDQQKLLDGIHHRC